MNCENWLTQLKYTYYFGNFGDIGDGDPISLSIEIKSEKGKDTWYKEVIYTYRGDLEKDINDKKTSVKKTELLNQDTILKDLNEMDLAELKNNYSTKPYYFSYWKLEYNELFKIVGSDDNQPEEIEKIVVLLDAEKEMKQMMENE